MFGHDTSVPLCMWLQVNSLCAASLFRITGLKFESNSLKKKSAYVVLLDKEASDRRLGQAAYILAKKNRHGR
jgi:hypothetical protein